MDQNSVNFTNMLFRLIIQTRMTTREAEDQRHGIVNDLELATTISVRPDSDQENETNTDGARTESDADEPIRMECFCDNSHKSVGLDS